MAQWNAKIPDELKQSLDDLQQAAGIDKKEDFLAALADAFRVRQAESAAPNLDRYRHITGAAKQSIAESFDFVAGQLDAALGQLAQRERQIAQERETMEERIAEIQERANRERQAMELTIEEQKEKIDELANELALAKTRIKELEEQAEAARLADKLAAMLAGMKQEE
jgi:predicted RNase H-like nuclease (RuvC/YqgF family)